MVQVSRLQDGTRKILSIAEVLGVENDDVDLQEIFTFERTGVTDAGKVQGRFRATGVTPKILERLRISGIQSAAEHFRGSRERQSCEVSDDPTPTGTPGRRRRHATEDARPRRPRNTPARSTASKTKWTRAASIRCSTTRKLLRIGAACG